MINHTARKKEGPEEFWRNYAEQHGEKVLAYRLGRYISGWDEFEAAGISGLWGLVIATSGGFRFHHFPQENWLQAAARSVSGGDPPQERTIFIPAPGILSAGILTEKKLWKRLFMPRAPLLVIRYRGGDGEERELSAETDGGAEGLAAELCALISPAPQAVTP
ncbi:MAG: hypothetical protein LBL44_09520 [Treponema sp.]|jgi:hypothetical protein|nr:hypothetical protein [Treponema sp.]